MPYLVQDDFVQAYTQATVDQMLKGPTGLPVPERLDSCIAAAQSIIDRMLRQRYIVPFNTLPPELVDVALAIAWHELWRVNGQTSADTIRRYNIAMRFLRQLVNGDDVIDAPMTTDGKWKMKVGTRTIVYGSDWLEKYGTGQ